MRAVIICGSRDWTDGATIAAFVRALPANTVVIHGDCRGADRLAGAAARACDLPVIPMPAQWKKLGKIAGPTRNVAMLHVLRNLQSCGYRVSVHGFPLPGGSGTQRMLELAEREGVEAIDETKE